MQDRSSVAMVRILRLLRLRSGRVVKTSAGNFYHEVIFDADCLIGSNLRYPFMASGFGTSATCKHAQGTGEEIKGPFPTDRCSCHCTSSNVNKFLISNLPSLPHQSHVFPVSHSSPFFLNSHLLSQ